MKFEDVLELVGNAPVFRTSTLVAASRRTSGEAIRRQLDRWVKSGRVVMVRRGVYCLAPPYAKVRPHPFVLANAMSQGSYVSLQSALALYGVIPEHVPVTTSITPGRPETVENTIGIFSFRHVKRSLLWGYRELEVAAGQFALVASPEKSLLDLLYITSGSDDPSYLDELRAEPQPPFEPSRFLDMAARTGSSKVLRAARRLVASWSTSPDYVTL